MAIADQTADLLDELTQLGMSMARDLHAREAQAGTPAEAAQLADAFHKISRSVRQSLALKAKLARVEKQDRLPQAQADETLRGLTRARVREACARLIWTEAEGSDAEDLEDRLETVLDTFDFAEDGLIRQPVADQIARIARRLGLRTRPQEANPSPNRPVPPKPGEPEKVIFEWQFVDPPDADYRLPRPHPDTS